MGNRRKFTAKFKAEVVLELLSGAKSSAELCREHQIAASVLADWKTIFLSRAAWLFKTPEQHDRQHVERIAELERLVGCLTLENDLLKKATSILYQRSKTRAR
jgi:transposase